MRLELRLLGAFGARIDGREVPASAWVQRRAAELVKLLALARGHQAARDQLIDTLWPALEPGAGAANLHKAAHHARVALGWKDALVPRGGTVALAPGAKVAVDAVRFERAAGRALAAGDADGCRAAADLYAGELLPEDRYAEWASMTRKRLREVYLAVLRGAELWERLLAEEPADEQAHRELMRAHAAAGNRHAAVRQYRRLLEAGARPDDETVALYTELRAGRPPLRPPRRARDSSAARSSWRERAGPCAPRPGAVAQRCCCAATPGSARPGSPRSCCARPPRPAGRRCAAPSARRREACPTGRRRGARPPAARAPGPRGGGFRAGSCRAGAGRHRSIARGLGTSSAAGAACRCSRRSRSCLRRRRASAGGRCSSTMSTPPTPRRCSCCITSGARRASTASCS